MNFDSIKMQCLGYVARPPPGIRPWYFCGAWLHPWYRYLRMHRISRYIGPSVSSHAGTSIVYSVSHDVDVHLRYFEYIDTWRSKFRNLLAKVYVYTWIFFIKLRWRIPLCVQHPAKAMTFQQIIMHALQYPHSLDDLPLTCSQCHV